MSKLIYNSFIGKIYDDKVIVKKEKFSNESIHDFDVFCYIDKRLNILFFVIGVTGIITSFLFVDLNEIKFLLIAIFSSFFFISMIYKVKKYYFKIVLKDHNEISIKVKKNEKEFAKKLTKEYWCFRKNEQT